MNRIVAPPDVRGGYAVALLVSQYEPREVLDLIDVLHPRQAGDELGEFFDGHGSSGRRLAKQKQPATRKQIAEGAPVDTAMCTEYLGSDNDAIRLKNDALRFPSLITLGYITATPGETDEQPATKYTPTDAGKEALKTAAK